MIKRVEAYCEKILQKNCKQLPFHNLEHTQDVVLNVLLISRELKLTEEEIEWLTIAAWFHDTGYSICYKNHEKESMNIAKKFLIKEGMSKKHIDTICNCIEATKVPQIPKTKLAQVLCDADLMHIGTPSFFYRNPLLRKEWSIYFNYHINDFEWYMINKEFLENHDFWTTYGKNILEKGKNNNLEKLIRILGHHKL
ncbi:HD domain-containing protein [Aquimarina sp. AU119]|uniref:HD domain-containing protein n=1 Tax=Aquimarina sp. AU119 TaxID=2108528 RepID=UPI000D699D63|nr:HD domain-containing protein [Aquimarina sp. AU119]